MIESYDTNHCTETWLKISKLLLPAGRPVVCDWDRLIKFKIEALINGMISLDSLVGVGSKRHVNDLDDVIT